jgi:UDP-GlcNAc:undecaprenyl-phosphate GlcNAc-1-phosphate transferase
MTWLIAICIALSIAASLVLVPAVRMLAHLLGVVDQPDHERKLHTRSVALGGGLAVYLALISAFVGTILIDRQFFSRTLGDVSINWYILFGAAGALLLVGLIDDTLNLRGRQKLLLQCLILVALVGSGTLVEDVSVLGIEFHLGMLAFPVTIIWLLVSVNALNLIDGADGMATTAGLVICAGLGFISLNNDTALSAVVAFSLAAALLGFLFFNRPPASIYLGDAGSMTIGLFVGVLAVWSSVKESTILASAPVAILAIPLFDSTAAVLRRWLTGRSIYATDRAHLHHLLQQRFGSVRMLFIVAGLCITTTSLAVLSVILNQPWLA